MKKHNCNCNHNVVDRFSSLPDDLLVHILSLLPTKDAAAASLLSTRLRSVFPLITNLDFDASTLISHCVNRPYAVEKYPAFITFVTSVLEAHHSDYLASFRLKISRSNFGSWPGCFPDTFCENFCVPDLKSSQLCAWISFPSRWTHCLRVLDLCILVKEPGDAQLPPHIFTSQTLEVLKLELNIGLHQVLDMPSYSLPRLKVLLFCVDFLCDDAFLPRLLAGCPLLEDLVYEPLTEHVERLIIQSITLRRLCLYIHKPSFWNSDNSDFVYIDTPNLEHFEYEDNLAHHYSIKVHSHCLVNAKLMVWDMFEFSDVELAFQLLINMITPLSHVQHLYLSGRILQVFMFVDVNILKDQLPMFPNLKHLSLCGDIVTLFWAEMLLPLLNCWPVLETLDFPEGIIDSFDGDYSWYPKDNLELEQKFFRTAHPIPSCCRYHLKTIVMKDFLGKQQEYDFIQFFLSHALVLENVILHRLQESPFLAPDRILVKSTLNSLPKASVSCSIQVL